MLLALYVICLVSLAQAVKDLPPYIQKCHRFDPKLNDCLLNRSAEVKPYLIKGIPELKIPPIDPFYVTEVELGQSTDAVNFQAKLKDLVVKGISTYEVTKFEFDVPKLQWVLKIHMGPIEIKGQYKAVGKVLIAPFEGKGKFRQTVEHCEIDVFMNATQVKRKGWDMCHLDYTDIDLNIVDPKLEVEGLFKDDKLNDLTNKLINDNIQELFQDMKPVIDKIISEFVEQIVKGVTETGIPLDNLYPPIE